MKYFDLDMKQEEKQLLLKDLCARLPYGVKILDIPANVVGDLFLVSTTDTVEYEPVDETNDNTGYQTLYNIKPYLRPMSSMTDEEKKEYNKTKAKIAVQWDDYDTPIGYEYTYTIKTFDWLLAYHFDFRGLIPMGLALEAHEGMYKTEYHEIH